MDRLEGSPPAPIVALMATPLTDIDLPGDPADHRVVVAMSGGVNSSVTAALLAERGFEVVGITLQLYDHGAAHRAQGRVLRRAGHRRRRARRRAARHRRITCSITRAAFAREVIEDFAAVLSPRRDPGAVHPLQPADQVSRSAGDRARPRRHRARDRALCAPRSRRRTEPSCTAPATPPATRAISCLRRRAPSSISCAFRWAGSPRTRPARWPGDFGLAGRRQARQPGHLLCAAGLLCRHRRHGCGPKPASPATSSTATAACSAVIAASPISPSGQRKGLGHRRRRAALCAGDRARDAGASSSARARRWPKPGSPLGELNWLAAAPPAPRRQSAHGQAALGAAAGAGDALSRIARPATPSWCSTPRPRRSRRARPRFSTTASGCSAAAGSGGAPTAGRGRRGLTLAAPSPISGARGGVAQLVRAGES